MVIGPPDVEDICAVARKVSADARSGNHVPQSKGTNAIQGTLSIFSERHGLAVSDLFQPDQRHSGEDLGVLQLFAKFLVGADHGDDQACLCRGCLQLIRAPLHNGVLHGFQIVAAPEEFQGARKKLRVDV